MPWPTFNGSQGADLLENPSDFFRDDKHYAIDIDHLKINLIMTKEAYVPTEEAFGVDGFGAKGDGSFDSGHDDVRVPGHQFLHILREGNHFDRLFGVQARVSCHPKHYKTVALGQRFSVGGSSDHMERLVHSDQMAQEIVLVQEPFEIAITLKSLCSHDQRTMHKVVETLQGQGYLDTEINPSFLVTKTLFASGCWKTLRPTLYDLLIAVGSAKPACVSFNIFGRKWSVKGNSEDFSKGVHDSAASAFMKFRSHMMKKDSLFSKAGCAFHITKMHLGRSFPPVQYPVMWANFADGVNRKELRIPNGINTEKTTYSVFLTV